MGLSVPYSRCSMTSLTTVTLLITWLGQADLQAWRGTWGFRPPVNTLRSSPYSIPSPEPEPEPSFPRFRNIYKPRFRRPFAEPEPEPLSRARFAGSFTRRFFDARVKPEVKVNPLPESELLLGQRFLSLPPRRLENEPLIEDSAVSLPAKRPETEPPKEQRSLSIPADISLNRIFSDRPPPSTPSPSPPPPPPPPPPPSPPLPAAVWNVDTELFEIVPAVPGRETIRELRVTKHVEDEEEFSAEFIALPGVPLYDEADRSRDVDFEDLDNDNDIVYEYLDIINCDFECVRKLCRSEDEQCADSCYQFCSRNSPSG